MFTQILCWTRPLLPSVTKEPEMLALAVFGRSLLAYRHSLTCWKENGPAHVGISERTSHISYPVLWYIV